MPHCLCYPRHGMRSPVVHIKTSFTRRPSCHVRHPFTWSRHTAPAVNTVIPQLVPKEQLMRYNGINASMQAVVNFAAPAAAGAVFAISTLRTTLMIDIVTAVIGSGILSCLALPDQEKSTEPQSFLPDIITGIRYAFKNRFIGKLLFIYGLFTLLCVPAGYLAGLLVRRTYGNTYWYLTAVEIVASPNDCREEL